MMDTSHGLRPRVGLGSACGALCNCVVENSDDLMFLKVCCGLDLDTSFALYLLQDDDITVLQIPDLENFFRSPKKTRDDQTGIFCFRCQREKCKVPDAIQYEHPHGYRASDSESSPLTVVPTAPREPRTEAVIVFTEGTLIFIPFTTRSRAMGLDLIHRIPLCKIIIAWPTSFTFSYPFLFVMSICNEGMTRTNPAVDLS